MRYAVVPQMYRRHLPEQLKSRSSHDIVLLCIKCHQLASVRANELRDALSRECNAPLHPAPQPLDPLRKSARSMAAALLSARAGGIPPARRATMLETVSRFLRQQPFIPASVGGVEARVAIVSGPENISDQVLRWVSSLPAHEGAGPREGGAGERGEACECDDKAALSHGAIVVAAQEDLASFIRRCRKHFLSSMDPVCSRLPSACACACLCMRVHMLLHSTEQGMPYASPPSTALTVNRTGTLANRLERRQSPLLSPAHRVWGSIRSHALNLVVLPCGHFTFSLPCAISIHGRVPHELLSNIHVSTHGSLGMQGCSSVSLVVGVRGAFLPFLILGRVVLFKVLSFLFGVLREQTVHLVRPGHMSMVESDVESVVSVEILDVR